MKLFEILTSKVVQDMHDEVEKDPTKRIRGQGSEAFVYQGKDEKSYDNVSRISLTKDPHNIFSWYVMSKTGNKNPYLPRIISVDPGPNKTAHTKMEPLVSMLSSKVDTPDLIIGQAHKWFNEPMASELVSTVQAAKGDSWTAATRLCRALDRAVSNPEVIADTNLKAAIDAIMQVLYTDVHFVTDFHAKNIMWRFTGNAPHLVLSDPVNSMK